jgi:cyd operon protein YbgT
MWYFTWILGVLLACLFGILNGMWHELRFSDDGDAGDSQSGR